MSKVLDYIGLTYYDGKIKNYISEHSSLYPVLPSTDGEYNLHLSLVNGVPTYTWQLAPANGDEVNY